jgi:hypothetical protein
MLDAYYTFAILFQGFVDSGAGALDTHDDSRCCHLLFCLFSQFDGCTWTFLGIPVMA